MRKFGRWSCRAIVIVIFLLSSFQFAYAGDGSYNDGTPDTLDLSVVFEFDVSPDFNPNTAWEGSFTRASELLFNATDGQVQLGKITFYNNCPRIQDRADIVIRPGSKGASAHVLGLGRNGKHLYVSNDVHALNQPDARGHFGLVHEMGHYVFGLYDEYLDAKGKKGTGASCISPTSTTASIMDGGTTVQPSNQRTEWALAADQAACTNTEQFAQRKMMDWPWIVQHVQQEYGVSLTVPVTYTTAMPAGHQAVTFEYRECDMRSVVAIDRSGSMSSGKLTAAKLAAGLFVGRTNSSDELGVSSFSDTVTVNFAIEDMTLAGKAAAIAKIAGLSAGGTTNIGGGLQTSLDMITGQGQPVSNEVIVLLSDGQHNTGTDPASVIPALKARGVSVFTIGLGSDADASLLSDLANGTGGTYFFANNPAALLSHYNRIFTQLRNDGLLTALQEDVGVGETDTHTIFVDEYTEAGGAVTFVLTWSSGDPTLVLVRPDGTTVSESDPDVVEHTRDEISELFQLSAPAAGNWIAKIAGGTSPSQYDLQVNSTAESKVFAAATTDKGSYALGEPVIVQVSVSAPPAGQNYTTPVAGTDVAATVQLEGAAIGTLPLFDDGGPTHGDEKANDGVYTNAYWPTQVGNYAFDIVVTNANGTTTPQEDWDDWAPESVSPFVRHTQTSVFVQQPPAILPDLVVQDIVVSPNDVQVVIKNVGTAPVQAGNGFWVDLYIDPIRRPTKPNEVWNSLAPEGMVWGVDGPALPLAPGASLTLNLHDDLYWQDLSKFSGNLTGSTPIYVQVDSANADTTYGGVLEEHEQQGGAYNNVTGLNSVRTAASEYHYHLPFITAGGAAAGTTAEDSSSLSSETPEDDPAEHSLPLRAH